MTREEAEKRALELYPEKSGWMKAKLYVNNHRVFIQAPKGATEDQLIARCRRYYPKLKPIIEQDKTTKSTE